MGSRKIGKLRKRKRFWRPSLTRDRVLKEALAMLDRNGIEALSMRHLAEQLGVSVMGLYNHVSTKKDLLEGIAAIVVDNAQYETESDDWRDQVRACFRGLRKACLAHPGVVGLVESVEILPVSIFRPMEITLAALRRAGIGPEDSLRAYFLLTGFTMGQVSYQIRGPFRAMDLAEAVRRGMLPAVSFPAIADSVKATSLRDWDFDASFELGLSIILAGIASIAHSSA